MSAQSALHDAHTQRATQAVENTINHKVIQQSLSRNLWSEHLPPPALPASVPASSELPVTHFQSMGDARIGEKAALEYARGNLDGQAAEFANSSRQVRKAQIEAGYAEGLSLALRAQAELQQLQLKELLALQAQQAKAASQWATPAQPVAGAEWTPGLAPQVTRPVVIAGSGIAGGVLGIKLAGLCGFEKPGEKLLGGLLGAGVFAFFAAAHVSPEGAGAVAGYLSEGVKLVRGRSHSR
jgi:hypothetical protein